MKVLVLSHSSELAGAERSLIDLFDYWAKKDLVKPHFVIRRPLRSMPKELRKRSWPYTALYYTNWSNRNPYQFRRAEDVYRNALFNTKAIFEIEKLIDEIKPDVVMTNTIVSPWAAIAAHFKRVPHVWFVREYGDIDHRHVFELGREKMLQDIDTLSSLVVANSKTLAAYIQPDLTKNKASTLYTPFDLELLKKKSQQRAKNPFRFKDSLKLVITGRIAPTKGQDIAAEAAGVLVKKGYNIELCVIGAHSDVGDDASLIEVIKKHGIEDRVHLVGHRPNALATVKYADVGIMASRGEAFGRVTFEYMAMGLPVAGANSGATPELVEDGKGGFLYEPGNVSDLADALMRYADNPELISLHGSTAQKHAESMMKGQNNADELFEKVSEVVKNKDKYVVQPINFAHRWLEYPGVASKYIKDSGVISFKRLLYLRLRHRAKGAYLLTVRIISFTLRGFRRSGDK
jgi:glycosyltransferase involved in cell wall biosynthesis